MNDARFFSARRLDCPVIPYPWPFARENAQNIATHWDAQKQAKPKLFDGRVLMCRKPSFENGVFRAEFFEVAYSSFLAWQDFGYPDKDVFNGFSMAALRTMDSAYLLGEMGAHTANAGQNYFPAGTPDLSDIFSGRVDLAGSLERELREETGLQAQDAGIARDWTIIRLGPRIACLRDMTFPEDAPALIARARKFLKNEKNPELADLRAIYGLRDLEGFQTPDFIRAFFAKVFTPQTGDASF